MRGRDENTGTEVAVKIMEAKSEWQSTRMAEIYALEAVRTHKNVIGLIDHGRAIYNDLYSGESWEVDFIVLELASGGVLSDIIIKSGCFDETMARHYFKQLLAGLDHCHRRGFAHRDLKP